MKYKEYSNHNLNPISQFEQRIALLEDQVRQLTNTIILKDSFIAGRLRTDRTPPTTSSDVQTPDRFNDQVFMSNYLFICNTDNSDNLQWVNIPLNTF